jgi:hypothetical protein
VEVEKGVAGGVSLTHRPFTQKERKNFREILVYGSIGTVVIYSGILCATIGYLIHAEIQFSSIIFPSIIILVTSLGVYWIASDMVKLRADVKSGSVEKYQGFVTDKYVLFYKPPHFALKLNGVPFDIGRDLQAFDNLSLGDEVILEWTPNSQRFLGVIKTGKSDTSAIKPKRNPKIPEVDERAFGGSGLV